MSVTVVVPTPLRDCTGGRQRVAASGATLGEVLDDLAVRLPALERRLRDERGSIRPHVLVFVDGVGVRGSGDQTTPVREGAEVYVAPAVSGG